MSTYLTSYSPSMEWDPTFSQFRVCKKILVSSNCGQGKGKDGRNSSLKLTVGINSTHSESIKSFIEDQIFLPSYVLAPPLSIRSARHRKGRKRDNLLTGEGGGGRGSEPNHTAARKPGPL